MKITSALKMGTTLKIGFESSHLLPQLQIQHLIPWLVQFMGFNLFFYRESFYIKMKRVSKTIDVTVWKVFERCAVKLVFNLISVLQLNTFCFVKFHWEEKQKY